MEQNSPIEEMVDDIFRDFVKTDFAEKYPERAERKLRRILTEIEQQARGSERAKTQLYATFMEQVVSGVSIDVAYNEYLKKIQSLNTPDQ